MVTVPAAGDPLAGAIERTKRLKLPHIRRALTYLIPTAKAQRWDSAEAVRVLLAEEAAGRDAANLRTRRKHAAFPVRNFGDRDETASLGRLAGPDCPEFAGVVGVRGRSLYPQSERHG